MADFCPIRKVDHLELYVGNAKQAAAFYAAAFGFATTAYRGLETEYRDAASYVLEQGDVRLVLTTALDSVTSDRASTSANTATASASSP